MAKKNKKETIVKEMPPKRSYCDSCRKYQDFSWSREDNASTCLRCGTRYKIR